MFNFVTLYSNEKWFRLNHLHWSKAGLFTPQLVCIDPWELSPIPIENNSHVSTLNTGTCEAMPLNTIGCADKDEILH